MRIGNPKEALLRVSVMLKAWTDRAAEQLNPAGVWHFVCDHLKHILASVRPPQHRRFLGNPTQGIG